MEGAELGLEILEHLGLDVVNSAQTRDRAAHTSHPLRSTRPGGQSSIPRPTGSTIEAPP